jgi:hypothetical protein
VLRLFIVRCAAAGRTGWMHAPSAFPHGASSGPFLIGYIHPGALASGCIRYAHLPIAHPPGHFPLDVSAQRISQRGVLPPVSRRIHPSSALASGRMRQVHSPIGASAWCFPTGAFCCSLVRNQIRSIAAGKK